MKIFEKSMDKLSMNAFALQKEIDWFDEVLQHRLTEHFNEKKNGLPIGVKEGIRREFRKEGKVL